MIVLNYSTNVPKKSSLSSWILSTTPVLPTRMYWQPRSQGSLERGWDIDKLFQGNSKSVLIARPPPPPRGGWPGAWVGGGGRPVIQILTLFQIKNCHFPHPCSDQTSKIHTCFQTWPLDRNYVIISWIGAQTKKFFKCISNSHVSISFLFTWNWNNKYVHTLPQFPRKP